MEGLNIELDKGTCLVPGCNNPAKTRGLCATHYMYAHRLVSRGKTTWADLEKEGKCLGSHASPNPTKDWFLDGSTEADIQDGINTEAGDNNLDRVVEDH